MIYRLSMFALLACSICSFTFAAEKLTLDKEQSKIEFVGSKPDGSHVGGFKNFKANAVADLENPSNGTLEIAIETTSLWSDNEKLTNHLKNPDFFDVRKYPKIEFTATKFIEGDEPGKGKIVGDMTMLGKTVEVEIPITAEVEEATMKIVTEFKLDRTKWGMDYGQGRVNNEVVVKAQLVFKR